MFGPCGAHPSVPARTFNTPPRGGAVKAAYFTRPRGLGLEGSEHDGRIKCAGGSCTRPVVPLERRWRDVPQRRVPTLRIVESFDEVEDGVARVTVRFEAAAIQQFTFQRGKETLRHRVVIAVADRTHRGANPGLAATVAELDRRVPEREQPRADRSVSMPMTV